MARDRECLLQDGAGTLLAVRSNPQLVQPRSTQPPNGSGSGPKVGSGRPLSAALGTSTAMSSAWERSTPPPLAQRPGGVMKRTYGVEVGVPSKVRTILWGSPGFTRAEETPIK